MVRIALLSFADTAENFFISSILIHTFFGEKIYDVKKVHGNAIRFYKYHICISSLRTTIHSFEIVI